VPDAVVRSFEAYAYPRGLGARITSGGEPEAAARAALRAFRSAALAQLRAAGTDGVVVAAEDLDCPPVRHRHSILWEY
jgi:hypothetical protein